MRIGLITRGAYNRASITVLKEFEKRHIPVSAIILVKRKQGQNLLNSLKLQLKTEGLGIFRKIMVKSGLIKENKTKEIPKGKNEIPEQERISIYEWAVKNNVPVYSVNYLNTNKCANLIKELQINILIAFSVGIVKEIILNIPNLKVVNAHAGFLPKYRGMNVIEWAYLNNDETIGTIHFMDRGIDTGDILYQKPFSLEGCKSIEEIRQRGFDFVFRLMAECVEKLLNNEIKPTPQNPAEGKIWYIMHEKLKRILEEKL
ncbi:MAG: formyltransferase family protein [bacterium]